MARILLLEPNPLLASQVTVFLEKQGHEVQVAHDAQEAINQTDQATPDIVILELLLAGHSGIEFLYEFRSYSEWQNVPAIIFSRIGLADLGATHKTLESVGVVAYLYKPETSLERLNKRILANLPIRKS